jgi:Holliday junction resolvase
VNTKKPSLEKVVVNGVLNEIRSRGGFAVKIHGSPFQVAGIPDILACYRGRFIAFECKRAAGLPASKLQEWTMKQIRRAGGVALLIYAVEQATNELDRIDGLPH